MELKDLMTISKSELDALVKTFLESGQAEKMRGKPLSKETKKKISEAVRRCR